MTDDRIKRGLENISNTIKNRDIHEDMEPEAVYEILIEQGSNWRVVWESIPTDLMFDNLYSENRDYTAFIYNGGVFWLRDAGDDRGPTWEYDTDVREWLLDHPPFKELTPIASLYEFGKGMESGKNPWLLFQYIVGTAVTSQGMGLNSLMGLGTEETLILGRALCTWGLCNDTATTYLELLLEHGAEE